MLDKHEVYCVVCDSCGAEATPDYMKRALALREAEALGWQVGEYAGGDDLCPGCLVERDAEYEAMNQERRQRCF